MTSPGDVAIEQLLHPDKLWSAAELSASLKSVPMRAGIYAWYFDAIPPGVPTDDCHVGPDGLVLLYVGICPKKHVEPALPGKRTLRHRLRDHLRGNASGSTLRLGLGCLLSEDLGIRLQRVGSGERLTFTNPGERLLDRWIATHAHVAFAVVDRPWEVEDRMLSMISLPLNLMGNDSHPFHSVLSDLRCAARHQARGSPIITDNGGPRRSPSPS